MERGCGHVGDMNGELIKKEKGGGRDEKEGNYRMRDGMYEKENDRSGNATRE